MNTKVSPEEWHEFLDQNLNRLIETAEEEGLREVEVRVGRKSLAIRMGNPLEGVSVVSTLPVESIINEDVVARLVRIESKHVGTFYRASQDSPTPVAEVGLVLDKDAIIGFVESLELRHEITSDFGGVLRQFLVEDGQVVEYGQAIAIVDVTEA